MPQIAIVALVILGYTLLAARLDRLSVSGPMILVTIGAVLGPSGVGAFAAPVTSESVQLLAELTLALLLFSDASSIGLKQAGSIAWVPARLLAIGLPLTIGAGAMVGWLLFPALGLGFALLMGSILAPTDAALSLPLLMDRAIPVRVRRAINIESGLNDGIATPFVTLFLAVVVAEQASASQHWLIDAAVEIALAIVVAIVAGGFGGRVIARARQRGWASPASEVTRRGRRWRSSPTRARRRSEATGSWPPSRPGSSTGPRRRRPSHRSSSPTGSAWRGPTWSGSSSASASLVRSSRQALTRLSSSTRS